MTSHLFLLPDVADALHLLNRTCIAGAALAAMYNLVAALLVRRFQPPPEDVARNATDRAPSVSILKPLHGGEPGLFPRLAALCKQRYPGDIQLICGADRDSDPAVLAVRLLQRVAPDSRIDLVIDEQSRGPNRKVSNLMSMERNIGNEIVLLSDSDIVVEHCFVNRIVAELDATDAGAVTCIYYGIPLGGIWSRLSAININTQFLPNVILAVTFRAAKPCFGSAIAMRRETLRQIGGMRSFLGALADDYAIGEAIRSTGREVVVSRFAIGHVCFDESFRSFWERHLRASLTIRSIDPVGYVGLIFMHPLMLAALGTLTGAPYPLASIAAALGSRAVLNATVEHAYGLQKHGLWLLMLHDAISFTVFLSSFFCTSIQWRGVTYRVRRDGTIQSET